MLCSLGGPQIPTVDACSIMCPVLTLFPLLVHFLIVWLGGKDFLGLTSQIKIKHLCSCAWGANMSGYVWAGCLVSPLKSEDPEVSLCAAILPLISACIILGLGSITLGLSSITLGLGSITLGLSSITWDLAASPWDSAASL